MRSTSLAVASLVFAVVVPAAFAKDAVKTEPKKTDPKKTTVVRPAKSLASCTSFEQEDKGEDAVLFSIKSTCPIPIDCTVSWKLVCAPDSKSRRAEHAKSATFPSMSKDSSQSTEASASECGADGWSIDSITWSCQPNKD